MITRSRNPQLAERYAYYMDALGLPAEQADVLTGDLEVADFFDIAVATHDNPKAIANWVGNDVLRELKGRAIHDLPFGGVEIGELVRLVDKQVITSAAAKNVFAAMLAEGGSPEAIVKRLGLDQTLSTGRAESNRGSGAGKHARQSSRIPERQDQPAGHVHRAGVEGDWGESKPAAGAGHNQGETCLERFPLRRAMR